jgi:pimeloyl-ACP methyl ester carboxylesterase
MKNPFRLISGMLSLLCLTSCLPASKVPIDTVSFQGSQPAQHETLVVFLPGRGSSVRSFEEEGLVQALHRKSPGIDMIGVEAHLGYYQDRTILKRLREDVIVPAQKLGYRQVWLVGISMGGLGAILYDTAYPGDVTGICVMAPYLGEGSVLEEIRRAGGLTRWQPDAAGADPDREIWRQLKAYAAREKSAGRVYLGFGTGDRFAVTNRFFGDLLPAGQVMTAAGGHDWPTWRTLWDLTLERSPFLDPGPHAELSR